MCKISILPIEVSRSVILKLIEFTLERKPANEKNNDRVVSCMPPPLWMRTLANYYNIREKIKNTSSAFSARKNASKLVFISDNYVL